MLEVSKFLNLGEWTVAVLSIVALWHWVIKALAEKWFQYKLDLKKQEISTALHIQKEISRQKVEFEKVKLERVLPRLEGISTVINEHRMMHSNFVSTIYSKSGIPNNFDARNISCLS